MELRRTPSNPALESLAALVEGRAGLLISLAVIGVLTFLALWLPPVSFGSRVLNAGYATVAPGGSVSDPDGTQVTFPEDGMRAPIKAQLTTVPRADLLEGTVSKEMVAAAAALPPQLVIKSPVYRLNVKGPQPGETIWTLPIPNDAEPYSLLDVYQWDGTAWTWLPHKLYPEDDQLEVQWSGAPGAVAVMQAQRTTGAVAAETTSSAGFVARAKETLAEVSPRLYIVNGDGTIGQLFSTPPEVQQSGAVVIPVLHNQQADGVIRSDLVDNLLIDESAWRSHVDQIVALVVGTPYDGLEVDYQNVDPTLSAEFTAFISELAARLHEKNKLLVVRVGPSARVAEDRFETGAYDWKAIGLVADQVRIPAPEDPRARVPKTGGDLDALLTWATGQLNRYKIELLLPVASYELIGGQAQPVDYSTALASLGQLKLNADDNVLAPGERATLELPALRGPEGFTLDAQTQTYRLTYTDDAGQHHTVYLENAASLAEKLRIISQYHLGGIVLRDAAQADPRIWQVLADYQRISEGVPVAQNRFAIVWKVQNEAGDQIAGEVKPVDDPQFVFTAPEEQGVYQIAAAVSDDGGATTYGTPQAQAVIVPTYTPTPEFTPTPTSTATPEPTATPPPTATRDPNAPTATPVPLKPTAAPVAVAPRPAGTGGFRYGIQAHMIYVDRGQVINATRGLGFNWLKQQIEWKAFEPGPGQIQWGEMDAIVNDVAGNGMNLLFSIVKSPAWARAGGRGDGEGPPANPQDYANFVAAVAGRYCGKVQAIEVWNEQNLIVEWADRPINASDYVNNLLRPAYAAIKNACPNMIVVSGALTPAGNVGNLARDDIEYLAEMYAAGLRSYSDAIGAHPSGFNCPADADWRSVQDPTASFRGPFDNRHHSWCFRGTMEGYRNVMVANGDAGKQIWVTEFGWAVRANPNPGYEYARDNTYEEQAKWVVQAYQMGRAWGWVGAMFLWNLNFQAVNPSGEVGAFGIVDAGWQPYPVYHALASMPK